MWKKLRKSMKNLLYPNLFTQVIILPDKSTLSPTYTQEIGESVPSLATMQFL